MQPVGPVAQRAAPRPRYRGDLRQAPLVGLGFSARAAVPGGQGAVAAPGAARAGFGLGRDLWAIAGCVRLVRRPLGLRQIPGPPIASKGSICSAG